MQERMHTDLEERSRALLDASVAAVDMRVRSRLNVARHAALEAAAQSRRWGFPRMPMLTAAASMTAAAVIAVALWSAWPAGPHPAGTGTADQRSSLEDLDIVASSGSGDAMDMMKDDVDFYAWVAASADNSGTGDHG